MNRMGTNRWGASNEREDTEELNGKAWVKDGWIYCRNGTDYYPVVAPGQGVIFYQNDIPVKEAVVVSEEDVLAVQLEDEVREPEWVIKVDDDRMAATVRLEPGYRLRRTLKDRKPAQYIELRVSETKEPYPLDPRELIDALHALGITVGIDVKEIARACNSEVASKFVAARGERPQPGQAGNWVPVVDMEIKRGPRTREDGSVDHRNQLKFPSVEPGQIIGIVKSPSPGKPGLTITGELVLPPEPLPMNASAGRGAMVVNETAVVATEAGHPDVRIQGRKLKVCVLPKLTISGDVDLTHGNVHYKGDVEVTGSVQDGMSAEARGSVTVRSNVNMAKVVAGRSVLIRRNIISGEVVAGNVGLLEREVQVKLGDIVEQLSLASSAIDQIHKLQSAQDECRLSGVGQLLPMLCERRFPLLPSMVQALCRTLIGDVSANALDKEWALLSARLYQIFVTPHPNRIERLEELDELIARAEALLAADEDGEDDTDCFISAAYVQNSALSSDGDIRIAGGVYNSRMVARGRMVIEGYARGGEYYAGKGGRMSEAGTRGGLPTKIRVPAGETIHIDRVLESTIIQIGSRSHTFAQDACFITAWIDEGGKLRIHSDEWRSNSCGA